MLNLLMYRDGLAVMKITEFIFYLEAEKHYSQNTLQSYNRDLQKFKSYILTQGFTDITKITGTTLNSYMLFLEKSGSAPASISRNIASIKTFYNYLFQNRIIDTNPTLALKTPKVEKKLPGILTIEETDRLLSCPDSKTAKGLRDKAMLELLYATGIRVSELISLYLTDVNLKLNYIICHTGSKERVIPFGDKAKKALTAYLKTARDELAKGEATLYLFTNCSGKPMSRQGFWKLIKHYGEAAGIETEITPHILRHSFAAHMVNNGADLHSVQKMLGHSDISSTQLYANMSTKLRDVYAYAHPRS